MAIVVFNPTLFKLRYPVFASVDDALLGLYFDDATLILANTDCSIVQNITQRTLLLNMLTAHIAYLNGATNGGVNPQPVGRVSSATEGSVSISSEYNAPGSYAWFTQSQYGVLFLQATVNLRSFRYIGPPRGRCC